MERGKYKGWIIADYEDKEFLEKLGVKLGRYDEKFTSFEDCELSPETLEKLDLYWGRFYWGVRMETRGFICGPRRGRWGKPKPVIETKEYKEGKLPKRLRCDNGHILHPKRLWYPAEECYYITWGLTKEEFDEALKEGDLFSLDMPAMILCPDCAKLLTLEYLKRRK